MYTSHSLMTAAANQTFNTPAEKPVRLTHSVYRGTHSVIFLAHGIVNVRTFYHTILYTTIANQTLLIHRLFTDWLNQSIIYLGFEQDRKQTPGSLQQNET